MLRPQTAVVFFPNLPAIDMANPAQTVRNLRAVADRIERAAADVAAYTDPDRFDGAPYEIVSYGATANPGLQSIELRRYVANRSCRIA